MRARCGSPSDGRGGRNSIRLRPGEAADWVSQPAVSHCPLRELPDEVVQQPAIVNEAKAVPHNTTMGRLAPGGLLLGS